MLSQHSMIFTAVRDRWTTFRHWRKWRTNSSVDNNSDFLWPTFLPHTNRMWSTKGTSRSATINIKGKAFSGQTLWAPGCSGSQISRQSAHESGCQPYGLAAFTPTKYSLYSFLLISVRGRVNPRVTLQQDYVNTKFQWYLWDNNQYTWP